MTAEDAVQLVADALERMIGEPLKGWLIIPVMTDTSLVGISATNGNRSWAPLARELIELQRLWTRMVTS